MDLSRRFFFSVIVTVMLFLGMTPMPGGAVSLSVGDPAPQIKLKDLDGKTVSLDEFRGRNVVIAFWSTWCSRCEEALAFLRDTFGKRADVAVILINQDSEKAVPRDRIRAYRENLKIPFPVLVDEGLSLWEVLGINALPTWVVVGQDGHVKLVEPNFYWASPEKILSATEHL